MSGAFVDPPIAGFSVGAVAQRELDRAIAFLATRGMSVQSFMVRGSAIPRYVVSGYPGSALACQVVGIADLRGMVAA